MELVEQLIIFSNSILSLKIHDNITVLDLIIYVLLASAVIGFIKIAVKGQKRRTKCLRN